MVPRALEGPWLEASRLFPILLLTGPRQVGKTTLLRELAGAGRRYVSLDDPLVRSVAKRDPALLLQTYPPPVLIDEVQYAPELFPYLKLHVDQHRAPGAFWLTGSQQFAMMKGVTESLAGRVAIVTLLGFSWREATRRAPVGPFLPDPDALRARAATATPTDLGTAYDRIWTGSFPAQVLAGPAHRDVFYGSYVQTYLERDVRDLVNVGSLDAFGRFLKACAARTGQLLNLADLARDTDVSVNTAKAWLSVLQASFQVHLLRPWHTNRSKRLVKAPKLYFLDTGLASWLTGWSTPQTLAVGAMAGPMLETFAVAEILKSWWHAMRTPDAWFYRDHDGNEVDLVLERDGALYPVEVKRAVAPRVEPKPFAALDRVGTVAAGALVCLAPELVPLDRRVTVVPLGVV